MREDKDKKTEVDWGGVRGAAWTIAGAAIANVAQRSGAGGLGGLFGPPPPPPGGPNAPVSREVVDLLTENSRLRSEKYTDQLNAQQLVWNARQQGQLECIQKEVDRLYTLTQLSIPNGNLNPGYGPAVVAPVSPAATAPDIQAIASAVATAVAAAIAKESE